MAEITDAGGIGCFSKQPTRTDLEIQEHVQGSIPSKSNFEHYSGSSHDSKMSNSELAGHVSRFYDDHRETSSSVRNKSRL